MRQDTEKSARAMLVMLVIWMVLPALSIAQESSARVIQAEVTDDRSGDEVPGSPNTRVRKEGPRNLRFLDPRRMAERLHELQKMMGERLDLSDEQMVEIDALFDEHLGAVRQRASERSGLQNIEWQERNREARRKMRAARQAGDRNAMEELRDENRKLRRQPDNATAEATGKFLARLGEKLTDQQRPQYREMVRELGLSATGAVRRLGGRFRALMSALRDPELNVSEEKKKAIREMVREKLASVERSQMNRDGRREFLEALEEDILSELTPEQRELFAKKLEAMDKRREESRRNTTR